MRTDKGGLLAGTALSTPPETDPEQAAAQQPEDASQPSDGDGDEGANGPEPNVTPEEQKAYEDFLHGAMELVYGGGKVNPSILKLLDEDPEDVMKLFGETPELAKFSPVTALAATTVAVVMETIRRGGDKPDDAVLLHAGKAILEDLAEAAGKAKLHDYTEAELNQAVLIALDLYREAGKEEGLVDDDELKAQFAEVQQMDQEGRLGDLLSGGSGQQEPAPDQGGGAMPVQP